MEGKFIIVVVVALFFIAFIQLMKIYDLAAKVRGKKSQEIISRGENMLMANMMLIFMFAFFGFTIWLISIYGANSGLYEAATVHGKQIDDLLMFNWWIILPVFFITNGLLFFFSWKYYYREERKATYISHNNKLEFIWTVIPAIVLTFIVIYGLRTWNEIMYNKEEGQVVEVYAYQFGWIARYAGADNTLGKADFKLVSATNPLGIINDSTINETYVEIDKKVLQINDKLRDSKNDNNEYLLSSKKVSKLQEDLAKLKRRKYRIEAGIDRKELNNSVYESSNDDVQVQEIHLIKDQPYTFKFRSRDVIHCPWFPHFRAQINAVPGMETNFKLTPTITTLEMRARPDVMGHYKNINVIHNERKRRIGEQEEEVLFDYILLCNKICGAGHSNMQLKVIVETQEDFDQWIQNNGDKKRLTISGEEVDWSTTKSKASL